MGRQRQADGWEEDGRRLSNYISLRGYIYNDQRYKKKKKPSGPSFLIIQERQGERLSVLQKKFPTQQQTKQTNAGKMKWNSALRIEKMRNYGRVKKGRPSKRRRELKSRRITTEKKAHPAIVLQGPKEASNFQLTLDAVILPIALSHTVGHARRLLS